MHDNTADEIYKCKGIHTKIQQSKVKDHACMRVCKILREIHLRSPQRLRYNKKEKRNSRN